MDLYRNVIQEELRVFEEKFREAVKSANPLLDRIMRYIVKRKGKQMRPMFVFLSARLCGTTNESTYRAASLVELLHTATLVHDDVVDEAQYRRNLFSINALWKNKIAVLVGDYMFSKSLQLATTNEEFELLRILNSAIQQMSEGELVQLEKSRKLNLDEKVYFDIIRNKTASLLASSCAAGAWSTCHDPERTQRMRLFGEKVGIAFQIKDDLFDYGKENVGKPTGNDIREKKMTLPLIYTLNKVTAAKRRELIYIIKNENKDKTRVQYVIDEVQAAGGIAYAAEKMLAYRNEALDILATFPEGEVRAAMEELVRYATDRHF
jgi:octaprenyl-diphosphate synthase